MTYAEQKQKRAEWLKGLKEGDEVGATDYNRNNPGCVGKVLRRTPTQLVVSLPTSRLTGATSEVRFNMENGRERTTETRVRELVVPTQEFKDGIERAQLVSRLSLAITHIMLERMSLDKLRALSTVINPEAKSLLVSFSPAEGEGPWELIAKAAKQLSEMGVSMPIGIHQELGRIYAQHLTDDEYTRG